MKINYDGRKFKPISITANSEISEDLIFHYHQTGNIITSMYDGGKIVKGQLIGLVDENGSIEIRYHQINTKGEFMTGVCNTKPQILPNGKLRLHETWQWTSGDFSKGSSILEEL